MNDIPDMVPKVAVDTIKANFRDEIAALRTELQEARELADWLEQAIRIHRDNGGTGIADVEADSLLYAALTPAEPAEEKDG